MISSMILLLFTSTRKRTKDDYEYLYSNKNTKEVTKIDFSEVPPEIWLAEYGYTKKDLEDKE